MVRELIPGDLNKAIDQRDRLVAMSQDPKFTPRTRELCAIEADYYNDHIAFRLLPKNRRRWLLKRGQAPHLGTFSWREEEEKNQRYSLQA